MSEINIKGQRSALSLAYQRASRAPQNIIRFPDQDTSRLISSRLAHDLNVHDMMLANTLLSVLAGLLPLTSAAILPTAATITHDKIILNPTNSTLSPRASTLRCLHPQNTVQVADIQDLATHLQNDEPNKMEYVPHQNFITWTRGTAKVCVHNFYLTENTHVSHWEVGWAVQSVKDGCCSSGSTCYGGIQTGHGDSGLSLDIETHYAGETCA